MTDDPLLTPVQAAKQWCLVRGCVALADHRDWPYFCAIHGDMTRQQRDDWSREHSFQVPQLRSLHSRIEFRRANGTEFGYDDHGRQYEVQR